LANLLLELNGYDAGQFHCTCLVCNFEQTNPG
jgi:hypothetical protein